MYGNCTGVNIYDASMTNSSGFWQKIYYDNLASMLNATVHGSKGKIPIDPKYAFYKNYRAGGYEFMNQNLTWRDYHNMVRYDVPVTPQNAYTNKNRLYKLGYFTMNGPCENIIEDDPSTTVNEYADDLLTAETITIEENNLYGLLGWSNLYCTGGAMKHYWSPLPSNYDCRVPVYFYSKSGNTYTIYRLVGDNYDIQHVYNCRVSITNARRFIFDFVDMGEISTLDTSTYIRITPEIQSGSPKIAGQYGLVDGKPIICTKSATWSAQGSISTAATTKELALKEDLDNFDINFDDLKITPEQTTFVLPADGEYTYIPQFTDVKNSYQKNVWVNASGVVTTITAGSSIYIEPRAIAVGSVVRIRGIDFSKSYPGKGFMYRYNKSTGAYTDVYNFAVVIANNGVNSGTLSGSIGTWSWDSSTGTMTLTFNGSGTATWLLGFGGELLPGYTAETVIMTINEEISYESIWEGEPKRLDENLYAQSVLLTSPNGTTFKLTVNNEGVLLAEKYNE